MSLSDHGTTGREPLLGGPCWPRWGGQRRWHWGPSRLSSALCLAPGARMSGEGGQAAPREPAYRCLSTPCPRKLLSRSGLPSSREPATLLRLSGAALGLRAVPGADGGSATRQHLVRLSFFTAREAPPRWLRPQATPASRVACDGTPGRGEHMRADRAVTVPLARHGQQGLELPQDPSACFHLSKT